MKVIDQAIEAHVWAGFEGLKEVPAAQLEWLGQASRLVSFAADEFLFQKGEPIAYTHFLVEGELRLYVAGRTMPASVLEAGEITGALPFSRAKVAIGSGQFASKGLVIQLPVSEFPYMIQHHYELTQALVHQMTSRVRDLTSKMQQDEKMLALGKLSAGLAHELNNPAGAIRSTSKQLLKEWASWPLFMEELLDSGISGARWKKWSLDCGLQRLNVSAKGLGALERSQMEEDWLDYLDALNVSDSEELAAALTDAELGLKDIEPALDEIPKELSPLLLRWTGRWISWVKQMDSLADASSRVSHLVGSVKEFTQMDRGQDKEWVPLRKGLEATLVLLGHKLRERSIQIFWDWMEDAPKVPVFPARLNQVWTNIIDNAIDALEGEKDARLSIKGSVEGPWFIVEITDNGPGIPKELQAQIFDPFFTTKAQGKGTGLGLDMVRRIMEAHKAEMSLDSKPGNTSFRLSFPLSS